MLHVDEAGRLPSRKPNWSTMEKRENGEEKHIYSVSYVHRDEGNYEYEIIRQFHIIEGHGNYNYHNIICFMWISKSCRKYMLLIFSKYVCKYVCICVYIGMYVCIVYARDLNFIIYLPPEDEQKSG